MGIFTKVKKFVLFVTIVLIVLPLSAPILSLLEKILRFIEQRKYIQKNKLA